MIRVSVCLIVTIVTAAVAWRPGPSSSGLPGPLTLRFHHLHLTVPDPAASMSALASSAGGTRVILQGLGVGVRIGDGHVLFDRGPDVPPVGEPEIAQRYRAASAWLSEHGADVAPREIDPSILKAPGMTGGLDHVAFAAPDLDAAVDALRARDRAPVRRSADAAVFAIGGGELVEIVRETDRPDAFWCPMHLDVRSPAAGRCAICGMDLVAIPPLRAGEYRLEVGIVTAIRSHAPPGTTPQFSGLQLRVADPDGKPVTRFVTVHEHPLHLFIISRDLTYFRHVHPEDLGATADVFDGMFQIDVRELPGMPPGPYMAIADLLPSGGTPQMLHRAFVTPHDKGPVFVAAPALEPGPAEAIVDGMRVRIETKLEPRKAGSIRFTISDAATGAPIADLEPFLGAPAHLLIVNPDLTQAIHGHPDHPPAGGSSVAFEPVMPAPGLYKVWVQFQRRGKVSTASFVVAVR
jgi:Heavy metal binding domain